MNNMDMAANKKKLLHHTNPRHVDIGIRSRRTRAPSYYHHAVCVILILLVLSYSCIALVNAADDETKVDDAHNDVHDEEHDEEHDDEHHVHQVYAVLLPWFVQALGIVVFYLLTRHLHALPYTAVLFVLGVIMGVGGSLGDSEDQLTSSIRMWAEIDNHVLFTVFLPGLLFKDAFEVNFHLFMASWSQLLCLAFPMVLAGTVLTALVGRYVFPYGWTMAQALTFGSIMAATDPVAVSALLNEVGAPPRLKVHISGESLLNDGSAVVFFFVFGGLFLYELGIDGLGGDSNVAEGFAIFFRMSLGGLAIGLAFAFCLVSVLYKLDRRMEKEEIVLQVAATVTTAYLSFYTSEVVCGCSGVISCVVCGITTKAFGSGMISDWMVMDSFWSLLEHLLNTVIFALGGIVFGDVLAMKADNGEQVWRWRDWGYLILLYVLVNAIRFFLMFAFFPINRRIGLGTNWQEVVFASWGGLRGAVGITLALALDSAVMAEYPGNEDGSISDEVLLTARMFGMVGGIALMTLVVNGTSAGPLLMKLGLAESSETRKRIVQCAEDATRRRILDDFLNQMTDERFFVVDFALVAHHVSLLKNLTADELQAGVEANKDSVHPSLYKAPHLERVLPYIKDSGRVRAAIVKAKSSFFASYMPGDSRRDLGLGDSLMSVTSVAEEGLEGPMEAPPALVRDTRVMFVELLRAAYLAQIKDGELDPREFDGFLVYALFEGLDLTEDAVTKGEQLCDWSSAQFKSVNWILKTEMFVRRAADSFCARKGSAKQRVEQLRDLEPRQYQALRMNVLLALSFIDAHKEAQDRLQDELGKGSGDTLAAFRVVMNESKAEVRKAREVLMSQTKKKLNHVISHYLCIILLNKQARYVKQLSDSGVLLPREVRHFLEEIDHEIIHIRSCPMDKHPGAIDFADESEMFKSGARGRKRVRQKSIL